MFLMFVGLAALAFAWARGARPQQLALLTAAIAAFASLLKIHPTGTYVAWFYPFLLIGFMCRENRAEAANPAEAGSHDWSDNSGPGVHG